jgi:hypothetical protein
MRSSNAARFQAEGVGGLKRGSSSILGVDSDLSRLLRVLADLVFDIARC